MLAKYLYEKDCGHFNYMLGKRDGHSHAWLQRGKIIVDITADQFADRQSPVIVTMESTWHNGFAGKAENVADYNIYDQHTTIMLNNSYQKVKEQITKTRS